jgi:hypothetical protein
MSSFIDDITTTSAEAINELEDHKLTKHIDDLRDLFMKFKVKVNTDPYEVINNDKSIRIALSEIIIDIKQQYLDIKHIADHLYVHSLNAKQLSEGSKPHIYQDCNTSKEIFNKMSIIFEENTRTAEEIGYNIEEIEHKLIKMRRLYESILTNVADYIC